MSVGEAASAIGIGRRSAYDWRADDEAFRCKWDEATDVAIERVESKLYKLAMAGDTTAIIFLLKARRPETYNRRMLLPVPLPLPVPTDNAPVFPNDARPAAVGSVTIIELPANHRDDVPLIESEAENDADDAAH